MAKSCLAVFGVIFLAILGGLAMMLLFMFLKPDAVFQPSGSDPLVVNGTPANPGAGVPGAAPTIMLDTTPQWNNPLEGQPRPTLLPPTPVWTPTPEPPLDPVVYRTEVTIQSKNFATALEAFVAGNDRLAGDPALLQDPTWRSEMTAALDQVVLTGQALSAIGPAPAEYAAIDAWLKRVGPETESLRANYLRAVDSGRGDDFNAAGDNFTRLREYLLQALTEMNAAGWPM